MQQTFYRNYDAALGRWIAADLVAEATAGLTPYQYSNNNPVMFNDPLGDKAGDTIDGIYQQHSSNPAGNFNQFVSDFRIWANGGLNGINPGSVSETVLSGQAGGYTIYSASNPGGFGGMLSYDALAYSLSSPGHFAVGPGGSVRYEYTEAAVTTGINNSYDVSVVGKVGYIEAANQGGPGPSWWQGVKDYWANVGTVTKMTGGWMLGLGANKRTFINDRVANSLRNSPGVIFAINSIRMV